MAKKTLDVINGRPLMSKKSEKVKALLCKNPQSSHCIVLQRNKQNEIDKKIESTFFKGQGVAWPNTELYSNFEYYYLEPT